MADLLLFTRAESSWIQIHTLLLGRLEFLDHDRMRLRIRILANARDLPRNFDAGLVGPNLEAVPSDLPGNNRLRELAQDGELITIVAVEGREVVRQGDDGAPARIGGDVAIVDVLHVRRLDEGMRQELVRGIERMIDPEGAGGFDQGTLDGQIALDDHGTEEICRGSAVDVFREKAAVAGRGYCPNARPRRSVRLAIHTVFALAPSNTSPSRYISGIAGTSQCHY